MTLSKTLINIVSHELLICLINSKTYFSITTKKGVQQYVDFRKRDVELGHIVSGRLATIATHLQHCLSFIGKDTKLKERIYF